MTQRTMRKIIAGARRGGRARGKRKARTPDQARAAALARWREKR